MADAGSSVISKRRRLPRVRFSLRTLVLAALLAASAGGLGWRWDPWPGTKLLHLGKVTAVSMSPDGQWLVSYCSEEGLCVWRAPSWERVRTVPERAPKKADMLLCWLPDSSAFCSHVLYDRLDDTKTGPFKLWRPGEAQCFAELADTHSDSWPLISPDSTCLFTGTTLWRADGRRACAFDKRLYGAAFSPSSRYFAASTLKGLVCVDALLGKRLWCANQPDDALIQDVAFSPDETRVVATVHRTPALRDDFFKENGAKDNFEALERRFPENTHAVFSYHTIYRREWRVVGGNLEAERYVGEAWDDGSVDWSGPRIWQQEISPDGKRKVVNGHGREAVVCDETGKALSTLKDSQPFLGFGLSFSSDGQQIYTNAPYHIDHLVIYHRRRPEYWWGVAWLPEFWMALVFGAALAWSVLRDRREL